MKKHLEALPDEIISIMANFGFNFLFSPNDFDDSLMEIAGRICDMLQEQDRTFPIRLRRFNYSSCHSGIVRGIGAGIAIGKHIERQRLKQATKQAAQL